MSRIWLILSIVAKGFVCFAFEGLKAKKVMKNKNIILLVLIFSFERILAMIKSEVVS